jgi:hypothetical protein
MKRCCLFEKSSSAKDFLRALANNFEKRVNFYKLNIKIKWLYLLMDYSSTRLSVDNWQGIIAQNNVETEDPQLYPLEPTE